jgi:hypothetical protein
MSPLRFRPMQDLPRRVSWGGRCLLVGAAAALILSACSSRGAADPSLVGRSVCRLAHNWREDVHLLQHLRRADPREPTALTGLAVRFRSFEDAPAETAPGLSRLASLLARAVVRYRDALVHGAPLVSPYRAVEQLIWRLPAHCGLADLRKAEPYGVPGQG